MSIRFSIRITAVVCIFTMVLAANIRADSVHLAFQHSVNGNPLILDSLRYQTAADETYSISRFSYLLSNFMIQRDAGDWIDLPDSFAWVDVAARRNRIALDSVPEGDFQAIRFDVGLTATVNHSDPNRYAARHPLNSSLNQLHWNWQTGYIFLALEGMYRTAAGELSGYVYHFANDPQRTTITLTLPQSIVAGSALDIGVDIGALLNSSNPVSFAKDGASTHSREGDAIARALQSNLPEAFKIQRLRRKSPTVVAPSPQPIDLPATYSPHRFTISQRFPIPTLPLDNPLLKQRISLGNRIFHDKRLSIDNTIACASCHQPDAAFSDPLPNSIGVDGQLSRRHSMPLFNLAWKDQFFWDGRAPSLREQVLSPIEDPTEMGESLDQVITKLKADPDYPSQFANAFGSAEISSQNIGLALESYLLSLTSDESKFDHAVAGKAKLSPSEQRGFELFMTEFEPRSRQYGADCFHCHGGALFTDNRFHDNGLEATDDQGLAEVTQAATDRNKFATPSLRNVALTAPYMHDGRFQTLEAVIDHYSSGINRRATLDPNLAKHPQTGIQLSSQDKSDLIAFLNTLSDPQFLPSE